MKWIIMVMNYFQSIAMERFKYLKISVFEGDDV